MFKSKVLVSEVGPRDGLQSVKSVMPTAAKLRWISALAAAGLREIEVGSFVPPKLLPQMADIREVVAHALTIPGLHVEVLAPNLRGCQNAFEAGVHKVTLPVSVTDEHAMANIRKTTAQLIDEVREIVALRDAQYPGVEIEAGVSVAFGCTIAGTVTDDQTIRMCHAMASCGVDEIGLSDTSGYANPTQVRRLFRRLQSEFGDKAGGAHFHNTRGQGLANVVAALDAGVTTIDASQAGLGGCPYAPGATGNIVTEDLVFLLEAMGYDTGIDIDALVAARSILTEALPGEALYGHVQDAGLPKGFTYADGRAPSAPQPEGCLLGVAQ
jgi:hydroxymethylglutaryl-CoA lyase